MRTRTVLAWLVLLALAATHAHALELQPSGDVYLAGTDPAALAAGDLDRDGDADLVAADGTGDVSVLLGDGAGGFAAGTVAYATAPDPVEVALGDLDRDGVLDLLVAAASTNRIQYRLGDGSSGFRVLRAQGNGSAAPGALALGDLNLDGRLDVVTANGDATVSVLRGDGHGDFDPAPGSPYSAAVAGSAVATGDMNGDSKLDVVVSGPQGTSVLLGTGSGRVTFASLETGDHSGLVLEHLDADAHLDAAVADPAQLAVLHGDGTGHFTRPAGTHELNATAIAAGDLDADGNTDLVAGEPDALHVLLSNGSSGHVQAANSPWSITGQPRAVVTTDVDDDGLDDVVAAMSDGVGVVRNASTRGVASDAEAIDFGPQPVGGQAAERDLTVDGTGLPTRITGVSLSSDAFAVAHDGCSGSTVADARPACTVTVSFLPLDTGTHEATLEITTDGGDIEVALSGSGADVDAPETTIIDRPSDPTSDDTPTFTFSSSEAGSVFACGIDSATPTTCESPFTTQPLDEGTHTFAVAATDPAGNPDPTPASFTFTVTAPPPVVVPDTTITEHPHSLTNDTTPAFRFTSDSAGSTFVCSVDGAEPEACTSPLTTSVLDEGHHSFTVAAVGPSGEIDPTPDTFELTIDLTAPRTSIRGPRRTTRANARYTFRFSEDIDVVRCSIDGSGFSDCRTPYSARALRPGPHVLRVQAVDAAGNVETPFATKRFRIVRN